MRQKIMRLTRKMAALYLKPDSQPAEFVAISQRLAELRIIYYQTRGRRRAHGMGMV